MNSILRILQRSFKGNITRRRTNEYDDNEKKDYSLRVFAYIYLYAEGIQYYHIPYI